LQSTQSGIYQSRKIKIGFSMDTLKEERWQRDRDMFVAKAKSLGADVLVQAANGNASMQISQAENLLTQNVDILVVVPANAVTAASIVENFAMHAPPRGMQESLESWHTASAACL
jgi:D-xylose transport system substrate-binding protein